MTRLPHKGPNVQKVRPQRASLSFSTFCKQQPSCCQYQLAPRHHPTLTHSYLHTLETQFADDSGHRDTHRHATGTAPLSIARHTKRASRPHTPAFHCTPLLPLHLSTMSGLLGKYATLVSRYPYSGNMLQSAVRCLSAAHDCRLLVELIENTQILFATGDGASSRSTRTGA